MNVIHVACAADEKYAPHTAAMLHSVLAHRDARGVRVYFLHGSDFSATSRRLVSTMVEQNAGSISFLAIPDSAVKDLPTRGDITSPTWYRVFLPELLEDVDRLLYLDADAIVVDSLAELWETDLGENYVAAVTNVFEHQYAHRPIELGLSAQHPYFNAGVLLMNLHLMRRDGCADALRNYALTHRDELLWVDQDTMNVVLGHRRLALHPRWNCMNSILHLAGSAEVFGAEVVAEARRHPAIRHFEGPTINKPWHYLCEREMRDVYHENRRQTPWPRYRLEGATLGNRLRRLRRSVRRRVGGRL